jgi:hypothetical protein
VRKQKKMFKKLSLTIPAIAIQYLPVKPEDTPPILLNTTFNYISVASDHALGQRGTHPL